MSRRACLSYLLLACVAAVSTGCQSVRNTLWGDQEPPLANKDRTPSTFATESRGSGEQKSGVIIPVSAVSLKSAPPGKEGPDLPPAPLEKEEKPAAPSSPEPAKLAEPLPAGPVLPAKPSAFLPPGASPNAMQRAVPTLVGSVLQMRTNESPIEKALELSRNVESLRQESSQLAQRLRAVEDEVRARDQVIKGATGEVQAAVSEVSLTREQLRTWAEDLKGQEAKLRLQEKSQQDQLRAVIRMLEKATEAEGSP